MLLVSEPKPITPHYCFSLLWGLDLEIQLDYVGCPRSPFIQLTWLYFEGTYSVWMDAQFGAIP